MAWALALDPNDGHVLTQVHTVQVGFGSSTGIVEDGNRVWLAGIGGASLLWFDL